MTVYAAMQHIGDINGRPIYWAEPGRFTTPGIHYWDGTKNVHVPIPATPTPASEAVREAQIGAAFLRVLADPSVAWRNTGAQSFIDRVSAAAALAARLDALGDGCGFQEVACYRMGTHRGFYTWLDGPPDMDDAKLIDLGWDIEFAFFPAAPTGADDDGKV